MPMKVREIEKRLKKAGFTPRPGKGDHTVWSKGNRHTTIRACNEYDNVMLREVEKQSGLKLRGR